MCDFRGLEIYWTSHVSHFDDINGAYFAILVLDNQSSITFIILNDNSTQDVLPKSIFCAPQRKSSHAVTKVSKWQFSFWLNYSFANFSFMNQWSQISLSSTLKNTGVLVLGSIFPMVSSVQMTWKQLQQTCPYVTDITLGQALILQ